MSEDIADAWTSLMDDVTSCRACPRLVAWREEVAREKRAAYRDEVYWGRPVPGFGDPRARLLVAGLAPAAHGGNRTGRVFTGDRSGDWLFRALHRAGYANQPSSTSRDDGLTLEGAYVTAIVKCAPPANKPERQERDRCLSYFRREMQLLTELRVIVALGQFAFAALLRELGIARGPRFGHGVEFEAPEGPWVLASFHPSQQNTFTGKLKEEEFDGIFTRARQLEKRRS